MKKIIWLAVSGAVLIGLASWGRDAATHSARVANNAGAQSSSASPAGSPAAVQDAAHLRFAAPTDPLCTDDEPDDRAQDPKVSCDFVARYLSMRARSDASNNTSANATRHEDFLSHLMEKMGLEVDGAMASPSFLLIALCHKRRVTPAPADALLRS